MYRRRHRCQTGSAWPMGNFHPRRTQADRAGSDFMGKKVQKEDTLGILEAIVEKRADFHQWGPFSDIEIMDWEGFVPDMQDKNYTDQLKARMNDRVNEIKAFATEKEGYDKLPDDALAAIQKVVDELK